MRQEKQRRTTRLISSVLLYCPLSPLAHYRWMFESTQTQCKCKSSAQNYKNKATNITSSFMKKHTAVITRDFLYMTGGSFSLTNKRWGRVEVHWLYKCSGIENHKPFHKQLIISKKHASINKEQTFIKRTNQTFMQKLSWLDSSSKVKIALQ